MPITVTFDLEDNRRSASQEARFVAASCRFLDQLAEWGATATIFIVGQIAKSSPDLVRRVARDGHEIGLHGLRHVALGEVGRENLLKELGEGRDMLEDLGQAPVLGFRAPIFSLTPSVAWAVDDIANAGFVYSSSVLPARNPLHGWPGAPREPFRWPNGLIEFPCPVAGIGQALVPFLGGVYIRYLPAWLTRRLTVGIASGVMPWTYTHPYDVDPDEPFFVMPHASWLTSRILHARRGVTLARLGSVIEAMGGPGPPMYLLADQLMAGNSSGMRSFDGQPHGIDEL